MSLDQAYNKCGTMVFIDVYYHRMVSSRRRSKDVQTPYSYRTFSSFLEDDNMSDIVRYYIKYNKMDKQMAEDNDE